MSEEACDADGVFREIFCEVKARVEEFGAGSLAERKGRSIGIFCDRRDAFLWVGEVDAEGIPRQDRFSVSGWRMLRHVKFVTIPVGGVREPDVFFKVTWEWDEMASECRLAMDGLPSTAREISERVFGRVLDG